MDTNDNVKVSGLNYSSYSNNTGTYNFITGFFTNCLNFFINAGTPAAT